MSTVERRVKTELANKQVPNAIPKVDENRRHAHLERKLEQANTLLKKVGLPKK